MTKKTAPPPRIRPLQKIVPEEITDPDEIRAVDEARRHQERAARVLSLCRELPRVSLPLLTRLLTLLAEEDQFEILADVLKLAPPDSVKQLEEELLARCREQ